MDNPPQPLHRLSVIVTEPLTTFIQNRCKTRGQKQAEVIREGLLFFMEAVEANQARMRLEEERV